MSLLRRLAVLPLLFCLFATVQCRRAAGGDSDPVEREAEAALIAYLQSLK